MSQSGTYGSDGGGGGDLDSLTPDSGGPVDPVSNTIVITSYPSPAGSPAIMTFNGGSGVFQISDLLAATQWVVGTDLNYAPFTSIGTAATAASLFASPTNHQVVLITPGNYTENFTIPHYVSLQGVGGGQAVKIIGNVGFAGNTAMSISNLTIVTSNSTPALSVTTSGVFYLNNVTLEGGTNIALFADQSGAGIYLHDCTVGAGTGGQCFSIRNSDLEIFSSDVNFTDTASTFSGAEVTFNGCNVFDSYSVDASVVNFYGSNIDSGSLVCFDIIDGTTLNAVNSYFQTAFSSYFITGTSATVFYENIFCGDAGAPAIDPALSQQPQTGLFGNLSFDGGATSLSTLGDLWASNGTIPVVVGVGTNGQSLTANSSSPGGVNWQNPGRVLFVDEASSFNAGDNNGYFCTAALTVTLPGSPFQGNFVEIMVDTSGSVVIQANTGQLIRLGSAVSSSAGTATNSSIGDSVRLTYRASDTTWIASYYIGAWTLA